MNYALLNGTIGAYFELYITESYEAMFILNCILLNVTKIVSFEFYIAECYKTCLL